MTKLTFTRNENKLRIEADGCTLVLERSTNTGRIYNGYVMAYGYGTKDMYNCWGRQYREGVTAKQGKQLLRNLFQELRTKAFVKKAWAKAQAA